MGILAIVVIAAIGGFVYPWISGVVTAKIPTSVTNNKVGAALIVGLLILVSIWAASLVVGAVGLRKA